MRDAVVLRILREKTAPKNRAPRTSAVEIFGEPVDASRLITRISGSTAGGDDLRPPPFGQSRTLWIQRDRPSIVFRQVLRGDALEYRRG